MNYRKEIDGLRAIAVIPVILFHAGFELFSGGFVGVDVFFVISGYLITTILIEDLENKRFSLINFYERRARRILPALFFIMLVCIPFAWIWMLPNQMKDFSQSLIAVSLFGSNVFFWRKSGYFDAANEERPLIHTWSLAVEEQYYVVFPIFLILAWRFGKNRVFWVIVGMAAISLLLSEWGWRNKATFYLAPTRAWELFAGSIAAFLVRRRGVQKNDALALLGFTAILFSIFAYSESTPFPGLYALVPVSGVVLVLLYAKNTLVAKLLSTKLLVGIGLVSYSAYLWHQPLFAFARIRLIDEPQFGLMLMISTAAVLLGWLSWKYVERPFRKKDTFTKSKIFSISVVGLIAFIIFGLLGHVKDGIPSRLTTDIGERFNEIENLRTERRELIKSGECQFNQRGEHTELNPFLDQWNCTKGRSVRHQVAVFGDSHAADIAVSLILNDLKITRLGGASCNLNPARLHKPSYCLPLVKKLEKELSENQYDFLIIANRFDSLNELDSKNLKEIVDFWSKLSNELIIFSPMIEFENFADTYIRHGIATQKPYDDTLNTQFYKSLDSIVLPKNVIILDTKDVFCSITNGECSPLMGGQPLLTDYGHLTRLGAKEFGLKLKDRIFLNKIGVLKSW
ncbi:acyltransferase [Amylibacter sp.]|nr:acyltransferase [Amylibacter sp.]